MRRRCMKTRFQECNKNCHGSQDQHQQDLPFELKKTRIEYMTRLLGILPEWQIIIILFGVVEQLLHINKL